MTTYTHDTVPTEFVEASGVRFAYRRFGSTGGVPLVFIRGHCDILGLSRRRKAVLRSVIPTPTMRRCPSGWRTAKDGSLCSGVFVRTRGTCCASSQAARARLPVSRSSGYRARRLGEISRSAVRARPCSVAPSNSPTGSWTSADMIARSGYGGRGVSTWWRRTEILWRSTRISTSLVVECRRSKPSRAKVWAHHRSSGRRDVPGLVPVECGPLSDELPAAFDCCLSQSDDTCVRQEPPPA
jgi:hypothetical protein